MTNPRPSTTPYMPFSAYGVSAGSDLRRFPLQGHLVMWVTPVGSFSPRLSGAYPTDLPGKNDTLHLPAAPSAVWSTGSIGLLLVVQGRLPQASLI